MSLLWRSGELSGTFFVSFSFFLLINFLRKPNGPLPTVMRMEEVPCRYWGWLNFGFYAPTTSCFRGWLWMPSAPMLLTCASWKLIKPHVPRLGMSFKRVCWTIHWKSRCTWSSNVCKWNTEDGCVSRTTEADCGNTRLEAGLFRCPTTLSQVPVGCSDQHMWLEQGCHEQCLSSPPFWSHHTAWCDQELCSHTEGQVPTCLGGESLFWKGF